MEEEGNGPNGPPHLNIQVAQLSQINRATGWVSFGWMVDDGVGQTILCTKRCRCQKTKSIIDLLHDKSTFIRKTAYCVFEPLFNWGLGATYAGHRQRLVQCNCLTHAIIHHPPKTDPPCSAVYLR